MKEEKINNYYDLKQFIGERDVMFLRSLEVGKYYKSIDDCQGGQNIFFIAKVDKLYVVNLLDADRKIYQFEPMPYRVVQLFYNKITALANLVIHEHVYDYDTMELISWDVSWIMSIKKFGKLGNNAGKTKRLAVYYQDEFALKRRDLYIEKI